MLQNDNGIFYGAVLVRARHFIFTKEKNMGYYDGSNEERKERELQFKIISAGFMSLYNTTVIRHYAKAMGLQCKFWRKKTELINGVVNALCDGVQQPQSVDLKKDELYLDAAFIENMVFLQRKYLLGENVEFPSVNTGEPPKERLWELIDEQKVLLEKQSLEKVKETDDFLKLLSLKQRRLLYEFLRSFE